MRTNAFQQAVCSLALTFGFLVCVPDRSVWALDLGTGNVVSNLDLSISSLTDTVLTVSSTNSAIINTVTIGAGQMLQINGNVTVGNSAGTSATTAKLTMSGGGTFNVSTNGGTFLVGTYRGSQNYSGALLDMSALGTFNANMGTGGTFRVGLSGGSSLTLTNYPTVLLASNSTITAGNLYVGTAGEAGPDYLKLGAVSNVLNVNTITLGGYQTSESIVFNTTSGTVTIRAADGTNRANINEAITINQNGFTSTIDFSGHTADVLLDKLVIGQREGGNNSATAVVGNYIFDTGTQNVNSVTMGSLLVPAKGNAGYGATGNMSLNGGSTVVNNGMIIAINAATNSLANIGRGTLIVSNTASVWVSNPSGPAITLAAMDLGAGAAQRATGTVNVVGGTLTLYNDMVHGASSTAGARGGAVVNLTGGALLMPNHAIVNVDNFTMTNAMLAVGVYAGLPVLVNRGTGVLAPGGTNAVGSTIISNSYVQVSPATLDIDLVSKLSYDRVTVTGAVTLAGSIYVRASKTASGEFDILTSDAGVTDTSTLTLGPDAAGFTKTLVNGGKTVRLFRAPSGLMIRIF